MDPVTGKCIWTNDQMDIPVRKLKHYIDAAQQGTFVPDRENDELTMAPGILSTLDGHEACQAPFHGRLGFRMQAVTNARRGGKKCSRPKCQERRLQMNKKQIAANVLPKPPPKLPRHLSAEAAWLPPSCFS